MLYQKLGQKNFSCLELKTKIKSFFSVFRVTPTCQDHKYGPALTTFNGFQKVVKLFKENNDNCLQNILRTGRYLFHSNFFLSLTES